MAKLMPNRMICQECGTPMTRGEDTQYGEKFCWFDCPKCGWSYSYNDIEQFIHSRDTQKQLDTMNDWALYILKGITIVMGENGFRVEGSDKILPWSLLK